VVAAVGDDGRGPPAEHGRPFGERRATEPGGGGREGGPGPGARRGRWGAGPPRGGGGAPGGARGPLGGGARPGGGGGGEGRAGLARCPAASVGGPCTPGGACGRSVDFKAASFVSVGNRAAQREAACMQGGCGWRGARRTRVGPGHKSAGGGGLSTGASGTRVPARWTAFPPRACCYLRRGAGHPLRVCGGTRHGRI